MTRGGAFASTAVSLARALGRALVSESVARQPGLLQSLDPRVRVAGLFLLILAATLSHHIYVILSLFAISFVLALASRVGLCLLATRVWTAVFVFTGVIALPALFLTPGAPRYSALGLPITQAGLIAAVLLILRVGTAATFATLLVLTTPWMYILKALRSFRVPQEIVMMLAMTHRYIFLLGETAGQMFESRQSRTVGVLGRATQRRIAARTAGVLLSKSIDLSNEVFLAMQSRGFRGEARVLVDFRFRTRDYLAVAAFVAIAILAIRMGRA